jgi:hypothetical protein
LEGENKVPKKPIWVSDYQNEVLRGYLGELLDSNDTPDNDKATLSEIYKQTLGGESNFCPCGVAIDSNTDLCDICAGTLCSHKNPTTNYDCVMCIEEKESN